MWKNPHIRIEIISSFKETREKERTRFKIDTNEEAYGAVTKKKLAFIVTIKADLPISKFMGGKKDSARANPRSDISTVRIVNFKDIKNSVEDSVRANIRDNTSAKRIVNFRNIKILDNTDINLFGIKNVIADVSLVDIKWYL